MSEGLNLQTSSRLINYDMPWNLMRVEQRIGRIDRIGSARPDVWVTNYFYNDTVEETVYRGIGEDYADFTAIIGNAQPVLAKVAATIEQLALVDSKNRDERIVEDVSRIREDIAALGQRAVQATDMGTSLIERPPDLNGEVTLRVLEERLTHNPMTRSMLQSLGEGTGLYELTGTEVPSLVTFDRRVFDGSADDVALMTYGQALLARLFEHAGVRPEAPVSLDNGI